LLEQYQFVRADVLKSVQLIYVYRNITTASTFLNRTKFAFI